MRSVNPKTLEDTLNQIVTQIQNQVRTTLLGIKVPDNEGNLDLELPNAVDRALGYVSFDASGNAQISDGSSALIPNSLTDGGVLLGSGSSQITAMDVLAVGELIVGDGTTDPVAQAQPVFDVRDYGASTSGSAADNATAIQAAFTAAESGGGSVYVPDGEFTTNPVYMPTNATIFGNGYNSVLKLGANQANDSIYSVLYNENFKGGGTGDENLTVYNLRLDGNRANNPTTPSSGERGSCVQFMDCDNVIITGCWIHSGFYYGINLGWDTANHGECTFIQITNNQCYDSGIGQASGGGITSTAADHVIIANNVVRANNNIGIRIEWNNANDKSSYVKILGNDIDNNTTAGITLEASSAASLAEGSILANNTITGTHVIGIATKNTTGNNCKITGNSIHGVSGDGIAVDNSNGIMISNNTIDAPGDDGIADDGASTNENLIISNNYIDSPTGDGIDLVKLDNSVISNNAIHDAGGDGIDIGGDASVGNSIVDNRIINPTTYGITNDGATNAVDWDISGNIIDSSGNIGIYLQRIDESVISRNTIRDVGAVEGIYIASSSGHSVDDNLIINNTIIDAGGNMTYGIRLAEGGGSNAGNIIAGNLIEGEQTAKLGFSTLAGNTLLSYDHANDRIGQGVIAPSVEYEVNGTIKSDDIELGHATDTTIARAAAGRLQIEGVEVGKGTPTDGHLIVGDGTTFSNQAKPVFDNRDYANLAAAIAAIGATEGSLVISDAETLTASATFPSTLSVVIHKGGSIAKASTYTVTINGPFSAGPYQVFSGFSAGNVTFGVGSVHYVLSEWWGAVTTTTEGPANDCTTAIDCALEVGNGIGLRFLDGYYGTTGNHDTDIDGQFIIGAGIRGADDDGGTTIIKQSGTNSIFYCGAYAGTEISHMTIDCNNLSGNGIDFLGYYGSIHDIKVQDVNGTGDDGYAFHFNQANQNKYYNLHISECDGGIRLQRSFTAGYSSFDRIGIALADGFSEEGIEITGNQVGYSFNMVQLEPGTILLDTTAGGAIAQMTFSNISTESAISNDIINITTTAPNVRDITFDMVRINTTDPNGTGAVFNLGPVYGCAIRDVYIRDQSSIADKDLIQLDGLLNLTMDQVGVYADANFDMIYCNPADGKSTSITASNFYHSGGAGVGSMKWEVDNLLVQNTSMAQSFTAASSGIRLIETGTPTWTNATQYYYFETGDLTLAGDLYVEGTTINMVTSGATLTVGVGADNGTVSAGVFTDRTKYYEGDALSEILEIKGHNGEIDHDSLPDFTRVELPNDIVERDIGAMVSMLTVAMQQQQEIIESLRAEIKELKKGN